MNNLTDLHPVIDVPQMLLMELAVGLDPFDDVCARHGYDQTQTDALRNDKGVHIRVAQIANDLKKDGITFRMRAAHAAEDLIGTIWRESKMSSTSLPHKIEALKTLAKLGDLEPKQATNQVNGSGVVININIPTLDNSSPQTITIDQTPVTVEADAGIPASEKNQDLMLPADYECE